MFSIIGFGVVLVFLFVAFSIVSAMTASWRISRMANKMFSLAEREMDRKINEASTIESEVVSSRSAKCQHCGSAVAAGIQCPNCGAKQA